MYIYKKKKEEIPVLIHAHPLPGTPRVPMNNHIVKREKNENNPKKENQIRTRSEQV
jgi:hypothetical protein